MRRLCCAIVTLLACCIPAASNGSDVFNSCSDCPVGWHEKARWVRFLRHEDVVFEGVLLSGSRAGQEEMFSWLPRFKVTRVLSGYSVAEEESLCVTFLRDSAAFQPGLRALVWIVRRCTRTELPCGNFMGIQPDGRLFQYMVDGDWRREPVPLPYDSLVTALEADAESSALLPFKEVQAIAIATLHADSANRRGASPNAGGTWACEGIRWVVGHSPVTPHFVTFKSISPEDCGLFSLPSLEDRFLLPIPPSFNGDTLRVESCWRPMLVHHGESVAFGFPADSLAHLYQPLAGGYRLRTEGLKVRPVSSGW